MSNVRELAGGQGWGCREEFRHFVNLPTQAVLLICCFGHKLGFATLVSAAGFVFQQVCRDRLSYQGDFLCIRVRLCLGPLTVSPCSSGVHLTEGGCIPGSKRGQRKRVQRKEPHVLPHPGPRGAAREAALGGASRN